MDTLQESYTSKRGPDARADAHAISRDVEWRISASQPTSTPRDESLHQLHQILRTVTESDGMRVDPPEVWQSGPVSYVKSLSATTLHSDKFTGLTLGMLLAEP